MPLIDTAPDAAARVYARSLFDLAESKGGQAVIEKTVGELEDILDTPWSNPKFGEFLASPSITVSDRSKSLDKIFKGQITDLTLRFLQVLNEKGRIGYLPSIAAAFDQQTQEQLRPDRGGCDHGRAASGRADPLDARQAGGRAGQGSDPAPLHRGGDDRGRQVPHRRPACGRLHLDALRKLKDKLDTDGGAQLDEDPRGLSTTRSRDSRVGIAR